MLKKLKDQAPMFLTVQLCICVLFYAYGCEPQTTSLINPSQKVNRAELKTEIELLLMQSENRIADLDKQVRLREAIFEQGLLVAQTGTINPLGVMTSLLAVLGVGVSIDDVRLRKKIKAK